MPDTKTPDSLVAAIDEAAVRLNGVVTPSPLQRSRRLSEQYAADVFLKREDMQLVRSFKIRGAYNTIAALAPDDHGRPIVCASAGNHAQGVAFACADRKIKGTIFMPDITPIQKIERVEQLGGDFVEVTLVGESYDDASRVAQDYCRERQGVFVHPFDDLQTIAGQGTVGKEIVDTTQGRLDVVLVPIGGGGLISGIAAYLKERNPALAVIGAEPLGSPSMAESLRQGRVVSLDEVDTFIDGAAVKTPGYLTFDLCRRYVDRVVVVPRGRSARP